MGKENVANDNTKKVYTQTLQINSHRIYLSGGVGDPNDYEEWFQMLNTAEPEDIVTIHINSYGGNACTALQLTSAMQASNAEIHTSISGNCCSAATMVFLAGDTFLIAPDVRFLIHNYSGGIYGKGHEIVSQASFDEQWAKNVLENTYKHFLTPEEIVRVSRGEDMWMHSDEVALRCEILQEEREKERGIREKDEQV